jgi:DNA primase
MSTGYALRDLQQAGVVTPKGFDAFAHRIVFPLDTNLYGRSIGKADPHRFLPGGKGGLYGWEKVRNCRRIVLVEGLFDWAALWQAGFHNVACSMGTCLNAIQLRQLLDGALTRRLSGFRLRPQWRRTTGRLSDHATFTGSRSRGIPGGVTSGA